MTAIKKSIFWILLCAFLVACKKPADEQGTFVAADISGGTFANTLRLTDHHGQARTLADFRGKIVVLFFGYTHCPDVCPTTMDNLSKALSLMGDNKKQVQVLFVTLDPERDTRQVLASYVPAFNPDFIGLYGSPEATAKIAGDFKVFYQKQATGSKDGYSVDHSAGAYAFDQDGNLRLYFNYGQKPQELAHDLSLLLKAKK